MSSEPKSAASKLAELRQLNTSIEPQGSIVKSRGPVKTVGIEDVDMSVDARSRRWSWEGRIPRALNLLSAREGSGKSTLVSWLAVQYSTGADWPDGQPNLPGRVLVLDSEDGTDVKLLTLQALGADMSLVRVSDVNLVSESKLTLAEYVGAFIKQFPDTKFVAIDVSRDFDHRMRTDDATLEAALSELKTLSMSSGVVILITHHEGKNTEERDAIDRSRGSTHWTAHCRSHWSMGRNPNYGENSVSIETGKSNYAAPDTRNPMIFRFESSITDGGLPFGRLVFDRFIKRSDFKPIESPLSRRGRKPAVPPGEISDAIREALVAAGGKMLGLMARELENETERGSDLWKSHCANVVADRFGLSPRTIGEHFRKELQGQTRDGFSFKREREEGVKGGRSFWVCCKTGGFNE